MRNKIISAAIAEVCLI